MAVRTRFGPGRDTISLSQNELRAKPAADGLASELIDTLDRCGYGLRPCFPDLGMRCVSACGQVKALANDS